MPYVIPIIHNALLVSSIFNQKDKEKGKKKEGTIHTLETHERSLAQKLFPLKCQGTSIGSFSLSQPYHSYSLTFLISLLFFPCHLAFNFYSMEYARITSTIGARHNGHFPPPRTNSFAHFEQVHMCPHLYKRESI